MICLRNIRVDTLHKGDTEDDDDDDDNNNNNNNTSVNAPSQVFVLLNPLNAELNPIRCLLALLGAHHFLHVEG